MEYSDNIYKVSYSVLPHIGTLDESIVTLNRQSSFVKVLKKGVRTNVYNGSQVKLRSHVCLGI